MSERSIDQLWWTWSATGHGQTQGFQVRAASVGLTDKSGLVDMRSPRMKMLRGYMNYALPDGVHDIDPLQAPACLCFTELPSESGKDAVSRERLLVHKIYTGRDGAGRPGAYFSHLIIGLSSQFLARQAIELWEADFWRISEEGQDPRNLLLQRISPEIFPPHSPAQINFLPPTSIDIHDLYSSLRFVIQAYLTYAPHRQLYVAGPPAKVAALIWGLTHCLPTTLTLMHQLTFSTYEPDIKKTSTSIVGTLPDLPLPYYTDLQDNIAINVLSGKRFPAQLETHTPAAQFADFAARTLVTRNTDDLYRLEDLLVTAEEEHIQNVAGFLHHYLTQIKQQPLTLEELVAILIGNIKRDKDLARTQSQETLVFAIATKSAWWNNPQGGKRALSIFCTRAEADRDNQKMDIIVALAEKVTRKAIDIAPSTDEGFGNLSQALALLISTLLRHSYNPQKVESLRIYVVEVLYNDIAQILWEVTLKLLTILSILAPFQSPAPPKSANFTWLTLFQKLTHHLRATPHTFVDEVYVWQLYEFLILQWVYIANEIKEEDLRLWLTLSWNGLRQARLLKILQPWMKIAIIEFLKALGTISTELTWMSEPESYMLFEEVLKEFVQQSPGRIKEVNVFLNQLIQLRYAERLRLVSAVLVAGIQGVGEHMLQSVHFEKSDIIDIVEGYILSLKHPEVLSANFFGFVQYYLNAFTVTAMVEHQPARKVLQYMATAPSPPLPVPLWQQIQGLYRIVNYIDTRPTTVEALEELGGVLPQLPSEQQQQAQSTLISILTSYDYSERPAFLSRITYTASRVLIESRLHLLSRMATTMGEDYKRFRLLRMLNPYIALILEETVALPSPDKENFRDTALDALLRHLNRGDKDFDAIEKSMIDFPSSFIAEWDAFIARSRFKREALKLPWWNILKHIQHIWQCWNAQNHSRVDGPQ